MAQSLDKGAVQTSGRDKGAVQSAAAGGANPKGVFGLPLHGPFAGPVA